MDNQQTGTDLSGFDVGDNRQNQLFDVLSHPHRRFILHYLQSAETPLPVKKLMSELVAWEIQRPETDPMDDEKKAIKIALVHNHLPKIAQAGLIRYDDARQSVTITDRTKEGEAHLETMKSY
ncbi:helix-turn-helix domain-containing protein [Haloprofundus salinisoli]|uniref:helix-turn-helix domain-containing protein n=1 Tax=Haloprofundus salinisoli TaxID=2876193 RepID=UPI001CD0125C|nr:helix-turn-helix domain-containing protein [Haloprofundus salinisoli]